MKYLTILLLTLIVVSCNLKSNSLETNVRKSIQHKLKSENVDLKIHDFKLIHISGDEYKGILWTNESGDIYEYDVVVIVHKDGVFEWEILADSYFEDD